jgi:iron-sulfur cluster repair protein YtfE (RIC family)
VDAVKLLKQDHARVKELFARYESAGERAHKTRQRIAEEVFQELEAHTRVEQEIFYPAIEEADKELHEMVAEGVQEHHVVDVLMREMRQLSADSEEYDAKFKVLQESVEHHIEEEERDMFPLAKEKLGDRMGALGERMAARKQELLAATG